MSGMIEKKKPTYFAKIRSTRSIVVSANLLSDIEAVISKHLRGVDYKIQYICRTKDKKERHYALVDLEKCDNSLDRSITKIVMQVFTDNDISVRLVFGKLCTEEVYPSLGLEGIPTPVNVYAEISGAKEKVEAIKADIDYQIRRYSKNNIHSFCAYAGVLFTLMLTVIMAKVYYFLFGLPQTFSIPILGIENRPFADSFWGHFCQYAQTYLFALGAAISIRYPITKLFHRVQFPFGDIQEAERRKQTLKEKIFWGVVVSLAINIFMLYLQSYLFG